MSLTFANHPVNPKLLDSQSCATDQISTTEPSSSYPTVWNAQLTLMLCAPTISSNLAFFETDKILHRYPNLIIGTSLPALPDPKSRKKPFGKEKPFSTGPRSKLTSTWPCLSDIPAQNSHPNLPSGGDWSVISSRVLFSPAMPVLSPASPPPSVSCYHPPPLHLRADIVLL